MVIGLSVDVCQALDTPETEASSMVLVLLRDENGRRDLGSQVELCPYLTDILLFGAVASTDDQELGYGVVAQASQGVQRGLVRAPYLRLALTRWLPQKTAHLDDALFSHFKVGRCQFLVICVPLEHALGCTRHSDPAPIIGILGLLRWRL